MAMAVPLADTAYAFVRRVVRGQSPFHPDRGHFHHRLLDMGLTQSQAVYVMYAISLILGLLAFLMIGKNQRVKIVLLAVALFITLVIILYVFFIFPRRQARRNANPDIVDKDIKIYEKKGRK
jgi:UDP-GlcNAc:undecaprenyl-phosphate GlcNAc-1-phosphate transferase